MSLSTTAPTSSPPGAPGRTWSGAPSATVKPPRLTLGQRVRWVALAFVPSSLMLGATTYITTDIAAIPLLWVLPLALYLLSFILVFGRLPAWIHKGMVLVLPLTLLLFVFLKLSNVRPKFWSEWLDIVFQLTVLFLV